MAYSEQMWQDAQKKCRLSQEDVALAKRLGAESAQPDQKHSQPKGIVESAGQGMAARDGRKAAEEGGTEAAAKGKRERSLRNQRISSQLRCLGLCGSSRSSPALDNLAWMDGFSTFSAGSSSQSASAAGPASMFSAASSSISRALFS